MYRPNELSPGERLLIWRRRQRKTIRQAAKLLGTTPWRYKQWEYDRDVEKFPAPPVPLEPLSTGEACVIARRRARWSIKQVARKAGWSHVTQIRWEREPGKEKAANPLYQWWVKTGWPRTPMVSV